MDRMKLLLLLVITSGFMGAAVPAQADESYLPSYSATPSGRAVILRPQPTPLLMSVSQRTTLVPGSCVIKATRSSSGVAPDEVTFSITSRANGKPVSEFSYDFGDGTTSTGSSTMVHRYTQAGSYTVTADPLFSQTERINPCKISLTFKGVTTTAPTATPSSSVAAATATPAAAVVVTQPETGPSNSYWGSILGIFIVWLGAELWYRRSHLQQ